MENNVNCIFYSKCNHVDCDKFCMKKFKCDYYYEQSLIPESRKKPIPLYLDDDEADLSSFTRLKEINDNVELFVSEGRSLFIYSTNPGNGKTAWSLRLANTYIDKTWFKKDLRCTVLFVSVPKFLLDLKANISEKSDYVHHILENVNSCDLVIWDDIGTKNGTEFEISNLLSIIDQRINNGKANIYTTNLNGSELHDILGDRLYSRVFNISEKILFKGKDKRNLKVEGN